MQRSGCANGSSFAANLLEEHYRNGGLSQDDDTDIRGASGTLYAGEISLVFILRTDLTNFV